MLRHIILLTLLLLTSCTTPNTIAINSQKITVDIADTRELQQKGLMNVSELPSNHGMLFVFETEQPRSFWMKNTLIPLDAYFFNKDKVLVDKIPMDPCIEDPCTVYKSNISSMYVLELNQGEFGFEIGNYFS